MVINSPGGSPVQSELIYKSIRRIAAKKSLPIFAFCEDVAASGGYFLAIAADEIYASENSIIGSIGVISSGFGFVKAIEKLGIQRRIYTSGKNKSLLDPFSPEKKDDIEIVKNLQKSIHQSFINYVKISRSNKLKETDEKLFNGEFWCGSEALEYGLIDGIADINTKFDELFGVNNYELKYLESSNSNWLSKKLGILTSSLVDDIENKFDESLIKEKFNIY